MLRPGSQTGRPIRGKSRHERAARPSPCANGRRGRDPGPRNDMTQQPLAPPLTQQLTLHCLDSRGRSLELAARLGYDVADPFAVRITFPVASGDVSWVLCRATLLRGLTAPAGQGDLRAWPSIDEAGRSVVVLEFCAPDGRLAAQAHVDEVQRFL